MLARNTRPTRKQSFRIGWLPLATLWMVSVSASLLQAASPVVNQIVPNGMQRGSSVEVEMAGSQLGDAHQILFYTPGLEAKDIKAVDANKIKLTITAAPDANLDLHAFRVVTKSGLSNLRLFSVSPLPSVSEVEPNNEIDARKSYR